MRRPSSHLSSLPKEANGSQRWRNCPVYNSMLPSWSKRPRPLYDRSSLGKTYRKNKWWVPCVCRMQDQWNVSFMSEKLRDKLKVEGTTSNLQLSTLHVSFNVESKKIRGLEILDYHKEHVIQLPVTFSREEIPASRSQGPYSIKLPKYT